MAAIWTSEDIQIRPVLHGRRSCPVLAHSHEAGGSPRIHWRSERRSDRVQKSSKSRYANLRISSVFTAALALICWGHTLWTSRRRISHDLYSPAMDVTDRPCVAKEGRETLLEIRCMSIRTMSREPCFSISLFSGCASDCVHRPAT